MIYECEPAISPAEFMNKNAQSGAQMVGISAVRAPFPDLFSEGILSVSSETLAYPPVTLQKTRFILPFWSIFSLYADLTFCHGTSGSICYYFPKQGRPKTCTERLTKCI